MKIKKSQLGQIIKEELERVFDEAVVSGGLGDPKKRWTTYQSQHDKDRERNAAHSIPRNIGMAVTQAHAKVEALAGVTRSGGKRLAKAKEVFEWLKKEDPTQAAFFDYYLFQRDQDTLRHYGESFFGPIPNFLGWQKTTKTPDFKQYQIGAR